MQVKGKGNVKCWGRGGPVMNSEGARRETDRRGRGRKERLTLMENREFSDK